MSRSRSQPGTRPQPVRTCVGCRERAASAGLLRVVLAGGAGAGGPAVLVPDLERRRPGRGAHLHPTLACLALAQRRRVWGRALRVAGPVDVTAVQRYLEQVGQNGTTGRSDGSDGTTTARATGPRTGSGSSGS